MGFARLWRAIAPVGRTCGHTGCLVENPLLPCPFFVDGQECPERASRPCGDELHGEHAKHPEILEGAVVEVPRRVLLENVMLDESLGAGGHEGFSKQRLAKHGRRIPGNFGSQ